MSTPPASVRPVHAAASAALACGLRAVLAGSASRIAIAASLLAGAMAAGSEAKAESRFIRRPASPASEAVKATQSQGLAAARVASEASRRALYRALSIRQQAAQAQAAARARAMAAASSGVNGLAPGGLEVSSRVGTDPTSWVGATLPTASTEAGRSVVTVTQNQQRALVTWDRFDIGRETTLRFDQSRGGVRAREWVVLNRIDDPRASPSVIRGRIEAQGTVLIINRNGVLFTGSSQVNVRSLVASAMDVGDFGQTRAQRDAQFFAGFLNAAEDVGRRSTFSLTHGVTAADLRNPPEVRIEPGGTILSSGEGTVILAAPRVENAGTIRADRGQVILAAGLGLRLDVPPIEQPGVPFPTFRTSRTGLQVAIRRPDLQPDFGETLAVDRFDGAVATNRQDAVIDAPAGNITMAGLTIRQNGVLSTTVANNRAGSVHLIARDDPQGGDAVVRFGLISLGSGALIEIGAEAGQTVSNAAVGSFEQGTIGLFGAAVDLAPQALIRAPSSRFYAMRAAANEELSSNVLPLQLFHLQAGAEIDVSGTTTAQVPVGRNIIEIEARGSELADSPLQRGGFLFTLARQKRTLKVDIRDGASVVAWRPTAQGIETSIEERQGPGGSVDIRADWNFLRDGSRIDVSGGYLEYVGGRRAATTRLEALDGTIYDIARAPADKLYRAVAGEYAANSPRWGQTSRFLSPVVGRKTLVEQGYVEGFDAGSLSIQGFGAFDGVLAGRSFAGPRQRQTTLRNDGNRATSNDLPNGGSLSFARLRNPTIVQGIDPALLLGPSFGARGVEDSGQKLFDGATSEPAGQVYQLDATPPASRLASLLPIDRVLAQGWQSVRVDRTFGELTLAEGTSLGMVPGATLSLSGTRVSIGGRIEIASGRIDITARGGGPAPLDSFALYSGLADTDPIDLTGAPLDQEDGRIRLGPNAVLSVRGRWENDASGTTGDGSLGPIFRDGGSISLRTEASAPTPGTVQLPPGVDTVDPDAEPIIGRDIVLARGALLDVSGGGHVDRQRRFAPGNAGTLSFLLYQNNTAPRFPFVAGVPNRVVDEGALLLGYGVAREGGRGSNGAGGALVVTVGRIAFGPGRSGDAPEGIQRFDLDALSGAGFGSFQLTAYLANPFRGLTNGTIEIDAGQRLAPVAWQLVPRIEPALIASRSIQAGEVVSERLAPRLLAVTDRSPTAIRLAAGGRLLLGDASSAIEVDPGADRADRTPLIELSSPLAFRVAGTVAAPAGEIRIIGNGFGDFALSGAGFGSEYEVQGLEFDLGQAVWIDRTARILARGVAQSATGRNGWLEGAVRPGGTVSLSEQRGWLVVEQGALIDVSGVAGETDLIGKRGLGLGPVGRRSLAGDAGSVVVQGRLGLFLDGTLRGEPGGPGALGGTLRVVGPSPFVLAPGQSPRSIPNLDRFGAIVLAAGGSGRTGGFGDPVDPTLAATTEIREVPALDEFGNQLVDEFGNVVSTGQRYTIWTGWTGGAFTNRAFVSADGLRFSGFDRIALDANAGAVQFDFGPDGGSEGGPGGATTGRGSVVLRPARMLEVIGGIALKPGSRPGDGTLGAAYVQLLGGATPDPAAELGSTLSVEGGFVDLAGTVDFAGFSQATIASTGDIRFVGASRIGFGVTALRSQGDLTLRGAQVYAATTVDASIVSTGTDTRLRIERTPGSTAVVPLSVGSTIKLEAPVIEQAGVLRAPFGQIELNGAISVTLAAGSLTSVSGEGRTAPYGVTDSTPTNASGRDWLPYLDTRSDQFNLRQNAFTAAPVKAILGIGPDVLIEPGARVDLSGGGELLASRFIPGAGGTVNVLARETYTARLDASGTVVPDSVQRNSLFADQRDVYAILPGDQPLAAPFSPLIFDSGTSLGTGSPTAGTTFSRDAPGLGFTGGKWVGDQITLGEGVRGLAAGTYTLLPGRYATLPGAYRVVLEPAARGPRVEVENAGARRSSDGGFEVPVTTSIGGTSVRSSRTVQATIQPGEVWRLYSEIETDSADTFFTARAARLGRVRPPLARDAGRLALSATRSLRVGGSFDFATVQDGIGGSVDLSSERIAIVAPGQLGPEGYLSVEARAIEAFGAQSVLIGGQRTAETDGDRIQGIARSVIVGAGVSISAPELILAARGPREEAAQPEDGIVVRSGARLQGGIEEQGRTRPLLTGRDEVLFPFGGVQVEGLPGDTALLRIGSGAATRVDRLNVGALPPAPVLLESGVVLSGSAATLDVAGGIDLRPGVRFDVRAFTLGSLRIVLGDAPAGVEGLRIGQRAFDDLSASTSITLRAREAIEVYGTSATRLRARQALAIDTPELRGFGAGLRLQAASIELRNSFAPAAATPAQGGGRLELVTRPDERTPPGTILLGPGQVLAGGFASTLLDGAIVGSGTARLGVSGALTIRGPGVFANAGSDTVIEAVGTAELPSAIRFERVAGAGPLLGDGGRIELGAGSIGGAARLVARGGEIALRADQGGIALATGALLDVSGRVVGFADEQAGIGGGRIGLTASGPVSIAAGAELDVAAFGDADAGLIRIDSGGAASVDGVLRGSAEADGRGGRFELGSGGRLGVGEEGVIDALAATLRAGGFTGSVALRAGTGDLTLGAGARGASALRAERVVLEASAGTVTVAGTIDATAPRSGTVELWGGEGVTLAAGGRILAGASEAGGRGGKVTLGAGPEGRILFDGAIDVTRGADSVAPGGSLVRLRVPVGQVAASRFGGSVAGARWVELESYTREVLVAGADGLVGIDQGIVERSWNGIDGAALRASAFGGRPANWVVTPGVELVSEGVATMQLSSDINLAGLRGAVDAQGIRHGGVLTLRSAGDLEITADLSDGFDGPEAGAAQLTGLSRSWSLRLVAGADTNAADPLAIAIRATAPAGDLRIGVPYTAEGGGLVGIVPPTQEQQTRPLRIRTGTGSIDLAAGRDIDLRDPSVAIYTAGVAIDEPERAVIGRDAAGNPIFGRFWLPLPPLGVDEQRLSSYLSDGGPRQPTSGTASYTTDGGDVSVRAEQDLRSKVASSDGFFVTSTAAEWLYRRGQLDPEGRARFIPEVTETRSGGASADEFLPGFVLIPPTAASSTQPSWWINFPSFSGIGALGGGNVRVETGRDFEGSVSVPTTGRSFNGLAPTYRFTYQTGTPEQLIGEASGVLYERLNLSEPIVLEGSVTEGTTEPVLVVDGGGDLDIRVGRDVLGGSQFLLARGEARIDAGGSLTTRSFTSFQANTSVAPAATGTLLGLLEGQARITARGSIAVSSYDPVRQSQPGRAQSLARPAYSDNPDIVQGGASAALPSTSTEQMPIETGGERSRLEIRATSGDVTVPTPFGEGGVEQVLRVNALTRSGFIANAPNDTNQGIQILPSNTVVTAFSGGIDNLNFQAIEAATGQVSLRAGGSITGLRMTVPVTGSDAGVDPGRVRVVAIEGDIVRPTIVSEKPILVSAGRDLIDTTLTIEHRREGDISSVSAGRDIAAPEVLVISPAGLSVNVRGPGTVLIEAGRDIAPVQPLNTVVEGGGIRSTGNQFAPDLPEGGAKLQMVFGSGDGLAVDAFLERYLGTGSGFGTYRVAIVDAAGGPVFQVQQDAPAPTDPATLARIRSLPAERKLSLALDLLAREVDASGLEVNRPGPRQGSYERGYQAIETLAPVVTVAPGVTLPPGLTLEAIAALPDGAALPPGVTVAEGRRQRPAPGESVLPPLDLLGNLNLQESAIRTEQGGGIDVFGPGGNFLVGTISTTSDPDPSTRGLLSVGYGDIRVVTRDDIQVGQGRVFTIDGGNILLWSSTRDVNAGRGSRTAAFVPPFRVTFNGDGTRRANRVGLITGSGIASFPPVTPVDEVDGLLDRVPVGLLPLAPTGLLIAAELNAKVAALSPAEAAAVTPGQAEAVREVLARTAPRLTLVAPIGAVDFGEAGARSAGDLIVAARTVRGSENSSAAGSTVGVPTFRAVNTGALTAASAASSAAREAAESTARRSAPDQSQPGPAILTVEVIGFGEE